MDEYVIGADFGKEDDISVVVFNSTQNSIEVGVTRFPHESFREYVRRLSEGE